MVRLNPGCLPGSKEKLQPFMPETEDRHTMSVTCTFTGYKLI
jgi:hypothetical protein